MINIFLIKLTLMSSLLFFSLESAAKDVLSYPLMQEVERTEGKG